MFRKHINLIIIIAVLITSGSIAAFAQTAGLAGRVVLKKADGTTSPVEGVVVQVVRLDQKGISLEDKTNKRGEFAFVSVPLGGTYILSVSGVGIAPALSQNLRAGAQGIVIEVSEGDGRRLTEEEVKSVVNSSNTQSGEITAEQKKQQEELDRQRAEIETKNAKIVAAEAIINRAGNEGIKAFKEKNYDLAISLFEEGYQASPDYIGSAPVMLNNKGASHVGRALVSYNTMVQSKDAALKAELRPKVSEDFAAAIDAYGLAWKVAKAGKAEEIAKIQKNFEASNTQTLVGAEDAVRLMVRTDSASEEKKEVVTELMSEYVAFEKDKTKKENAQINLGMYMNKVYDFDAAVKEFRKATEIAPNNPDAVGYLALALYTLASMKDDTALRQEALNYLQYFVETAPKDHAFQADFPPVINELKALKLKPQKIAVKN